ncbi:M48 family metalloprotease [Marinicella sp. S1101]|uniref:M56 family metallopeptidase n=1 Tax=Marinicella marina TaxID=2996016 RepID=UPI002260AE38|nr:M56 family metallopeptidase [Marinicella marina]MCX7555001.1 M48 family metalloprotease [Marinicella marina]MDJ1141335.1 M56 family metallopeptidase [Marinicella marina]
MFGTELQHLISSLGWSLVHFLWQGTLITLAYWIITRNIQSIQAKYWTGMGMVLLSLITPLINTLQFSATTDPTAGMVVLAPTVISHQQLSLSSLGMYFVNQSLPYFVLAWAATVLFLSIRLVRSWLQLAAIRHDCDPLLSSELKSYIKRIAIKLDLPVIPALKISQQVLVPAAYGVLKPTVLVPLSLISQIPREQLEAIIKHELCHLKRNDFIHNIIQLCADTLLFFHPGIRWMNNDIRHVREQCCDQMVLSNDTETLTYAKALTNIAEFSNGLKLKHSVHLGINDGLLLTRVKFLLQNKSSQSSLMIFAPLLMLIAFSVLLLQPTLNASSDIKDGAVISTKELTANTTEPESKSTQSRTLLRNNAFYPQLKAPVNNTTTIIDRAPPEPTNDNSDMAMRNEITKMVDAQLGEWEALNLKDNEKPELPSMDQLAESVSLIDSQTRLDDSFILNQQSTTNDQQGAIAFAENSIASNAPLTSSVSKELNSFNQDKQLSITPKFKRYVAPLYPQSFWYNQVEQDVIATFKIRHDGKAYDIKFNSVTNTHVAFEKEVEKAMKYWRFDTAALNSSMLKRTYQQIFSFALSEELEKNCEVARTGSRLSKPVPCNK